MVWAEKFSMSVGSALFIVKNYMSSHEHGSTAEAEPDSTDFCAGGKNGVILLDPNFVQKFRESIFHHFTDIVIPDI